MRNSKILAKVRTGQTARIAMMGHFLPPFVAYAAHYGYDGIWLDLEHRPFDHREVQAMLAYFHLYDIDCLLRPPTREKGQLYRYLEDGVTGLVIPHISDVDSARELVQKVKFPPVGDRGLEGRGLETNFGLDIPVTRDPLVAHALKETFLLVQIETPQGLAAVEEIAAIPGIDGLYIGPQDLRIRMMNLPEGERVSQEDVARRVAAVCQQHGKLWGSLPSSVDEMRSHAELGSQLLVWGIDVRMLQAGLAASAGELDSILG
ncbi:MAG: 4-hydroxy-2-oxovalerate aldolase [Anaerolineae bacterium]|nr:4-hydroxy-2-oxovalerate aldolase [Anaerolineae bacterium]